MPAPDDIRVALEGPRLPFKELQSISSPRRAETAARDHSALPYVFDEQCTCVARGSHEQQPPQ